MRAYLDTSVVLPLLVRDALSEKADRLLRSEAWSLVLSSLAVAEFSSALARRIGMGEMAIADARARLSEFDSWRSRFAQTVAVEAADFAVADAHIRRFDLSLRTPDALHVAVAARLEATLLTFDRALAADAGTLGVAVRGLG